MKGVLTSIDVWRDGGSLSVTFNCDDLVVRTLFFQVNLTESDSKKIGYLAPFLDQCVSTPWTNPVTGHVYDELATTRSATTWAESARILRMLAPQVASASVANRSMFSEMEYAAAHGGKLSRDAA